ARYEAVVNQLRHINPCMQVQDPNTKQTLHLYTTIFPDHTFRRDLEVYIVPRDKSGTQFLPKNPRPDELRLAKIREVITRAEQELKDFRKQYPGSAHHLGRA